MDLKWLNMEEQIRVKGFFYFFFFFWFIFFGFDTLQAEVGLSAFYSCNYSIRSLVTYRH